MTRKTILYTLLLLSTSFLNAQVGINTETPTRMLDVNGDLRVTVLADKTNTTDYTEILTANSDNNVDKISKPAIIEDATKQVEIVKSIYNSSTAITTRITQCGKLSFRINGFSIEMKLLYQPSNTITLTYGGKRWGQISSSINNGYSYRNLSLSVTNSNWNTYQNIDPTFQLRQGSYLNYHFIIPGDGDLYRITASRLKNTDSESNYSLICERFYKKQ